MLSLEKVQNVLRDLELWEGTVNMSEDYHAMKYPDLIYDVGMHKGEDTDYYLRKGFSVIGFEADPDLAAYCRNRFSDAIESSKLIVVEGAIAEAKTGDGEGKAIKFYKNPSISVWGTVDADWARRNELLGAPSEVIEVPIVDFAACLEKFGIPHYCKIDIEGMDIVCLKALRNFSHKPDYLSIEAEKVSFESLSIEVNLLSELGYNQFKAIQQSSIARQKEPNPSEEHGYVGYQFGVGASGLFGADLPGNWMDKTRVINRYKAIFRRYRVFGDYGILRKAYPGKALVKAVSIITRRPIPGYYDTHVKHADAR
jgi:FkbM family methyltransferase